MASIKDGHSMMLPPITKELIAHAKNDGKTILLRIKATGNVFVVDYPVTNDTQTCKGDTILSINGVHSKDILNRMYNLFASEKGNAIKEYTVSSYSKAYNKERHKEIYDQICNLPDGSPVCYKGQFNKRK